MSKKARKEATSMKIDSEVWKEAKIESIRREITLSQFVEEALRKELDKGEK